MISPGSLIYDWNTVATPKRPRPVLLDDETLRDGLQSPSVRCPTIDEKLRILHLTDRLGIDTADIGLPGAGPHVVQDVEPGRVDPRHHVGVGEPLQLISIERQHQVYRPSLWPLPGAFCSTVFVPAPDCVWRVPRSL